MTRWAHTEDALDVKAYFCDPRSPWQRPTNEQTNSLLRRWLPKGTDLNVGAVRLAVIEDHLNTMPRKLHDWHSAHSVYAELTCIHRYSLSTVIVNADTTSLQARPSDWASREAKSGTNAKGEATANSHRRAIATRPKA